MARRGRRSGHWTGRLQQAARWRWGDSFALLMLATAAGAGQAALYWDWGEPAEAGGAAVAAICALVVVWRAQPILSGVWGLTDPVRAHLVSLIAQRLAQRLARRHAVRTARDQGGVAGLDGAEYEAYCAALLEDAGWRVRITDPGPDQGLDLVAERSGLRVAIQCKHYTKPVGVSAVQEIVAARALVGPQARAAVVASRGFTRSAESLAQANRVALVHHRQLAGLEAHLAAAGDKPALTA